MPSPPEARKDLRSFSVLGVKTSNRDREVLVRRFRKSQYHDIESELRAHRPEPRSAFLASLSEDVRGHGRRRYGMRRAALAGVLTAGMIAAFAGFGGMGYAATSAKQVIQVAKITKVVGVKFNHRPGHPTPPGHSQYKPGKGCGDKNHVHARENECKKPPK